MNGTDDCACSTSFYLMHLILAFLDNHETHADLHNCSNYDDQIGSTMVREVALSVLDTVCRRRSQTTVYSCLNRHPENC